MPNYSCCAACGGSELQSSATQVSQEEDENGCYEEETEFGHTCSNCGHIVAAHWHKFTTDAVTRRWVMECALSVNASFK